MLPLIAAPAHEWSTLLTILKHTQHSAEVVGHNKKTIITLDMDLCMRAVRLQSLKPELAENRILRDGKFHTVLCALRAIGSSIEASGIDDAWVEADIYGPTTTRQILEGRHMKRAVTAHIITLQALSDLFMDEYKSSEGPLPVALNERMVVLKSACSDYDTERAKQIPGNISQLASDLKNSCTSSATWDDLTKIQRDENVHGYRSHSPTVHKGITAGRLDASSYFPGEILFILLQPK